ncbi:hypothetical protein LguiB_003224 [Lonicera macranthoides]
MALHYYFMAINKNTCSLCYLRKSTQLQHTPRPPSTISHNFLSWVFSVLQ